MWRLWDYIVYFLLCVVFFFFFKQKTAYELRISYWSSDFCSSDLHQPEPITQIDNIAAYNTREGLALNPEEIQYLEDVSRQLGRKLTDSEVFGRSEERSVGHECVSTCRSRWSPYQ